MALLGTLDRASVAAQYQADASGLRDPFPGLVRADIVAAINAVDDWVEANKVSFNSAIPLPARTAMTAPQKAKLLLYVVKRRFEVGA